MTTQLLCIGDIHLGRRPSRLPADLEEWGVPRSGLTPVAAWRRAVEVAIEREVDAVVLAGDVVEADNRYFEAFGPLEDGVRRLVEAGVTVTGVAGNHDVEVLPRLADQIPGFILLGRGGRWQSFELQAPGKPAVRLLGWSFPGRWAEGSPFDSLPAEVDGSLATVGVLHCDLDQRGSAYAPVSSAALRAAPGDAWLLGHIHQPSLRPGPSPRGYLGVLSGLDPGETGERGAWLLEVAGPGRVTISRLALAPLRWEAVAIDAGELDGPDDLERAVPEAIRRLHSEIAPGLGETRAIGCRVRLEGASPRHRDLAAALERADPAALRLQIDGRVYFVEALVDDARPAIDLAEMARGSDPPALLARMLLDIEGGTGPGRALVERAAAELAGTADAPNFAALDRVVDLESAAREHLLRAGCAALEALLAQRAGS